MKIMHVLWGLKYGGAETMLVDIINLQCIKNEVEVLFINNNFDNQLLSQIHQKVKITRIDRPLKSKNPIYLIWLNLHILFSNADIIHFHQDDIIRYIPIRFLKNNLCLTVHSTKLGVNDIQNYNYVFAISDAVRESVKRQTGIQVPVILNGINIQKFNKDKTQHNPDIFKIVQVGRLHHLPKGQDLTLQAIYHLITQQQEPKIHLDIIGEGDSIQYLKGLVEQLHIDSYVTFLGNKTKDYIRENMAGYDLLVQPSRWEGFGLVITEAMASMTPTLISNVEGMKMASLNGTLAYTFQSEDVYDYTQKLQQIIHLPAMEREKLAKKAYNYIVENFDISYTVKNYEHHYKCILSNKKTNNNNR
jgi:glycosyltransferase involved in cell wall biosynthesis